MSKVNKTEQRDRRRKRIRSKIQGTAKRPRLSVFKSNRELYVQLIDDEARVTLLSAHDKDASKLGKAIADKSLQQKISQVVFDRGGYIYIGKIRELAEAARASGLKF